MPNVKIDESNDLLCPACGCANLHHSWVTAFERDKEDAPTYVLVMQDGSIRDVGELGENPSSRRNGIAIRFWCEGCHALSELTLAQNKGTTTMGWRPTVPSQSGGAHTLDSRDVRVFARPRPRLVASRQDSESR